jgi:hypothetical protein
MFLCIAGHSTLAETYMALGVLGNNRTMYNSGVNLFTSTVADYLKWGKGSFAVQNGNMTRLLGECSDTMRDMYHSQFGLGGLLQAAEIAWQQVGGAGHSRQFMGWWAADN